MSMDVDKLLNSLRENGTIDMTDGSFTVSLSEARRKLVQYQSSDPRRYLLILIAGLIGGGARRITIVREELTCTVTAAGTSLQEAGMTEAYSGRVEEARYPGVTDLILGLRLAFRCECLEIELEQEFQGKRGYRWELTEKDEDSFSTGEGQETSMTLRLSFQSTWKSRAAGFFKFFGGYVGQNQEVRLLIKYCDHSPVPILVDGQAVHQNFLVGLDWVCALVGESFRVSAGRPSLVVSDLPWEGVLALHPGPVDLVLNGVTYSRLEDSPLSGVVRHPGLKLDLSRENVLQDATYEQFMLELEDVQDRLLVIFSKSLSAQDDDNVLPCLYDLVRVSLKREDYPMIRRVLDWMNGRKVAVMDVPVIRRSSDDANDVVEVYNDLAVYFKLKPWESQSVFILDKCSKALVERSARLDELLSDTATLIQRSYPEDLLAAGYLLLGLGACLHLFGSPNAGRNVWEEARDTVRRSDDPKALELLEAHLRYDVDHMMLEVAKALQIYSQSKESFSFK